MRILLRKFVCAVFGFETFFLLPMLPLAIFFLQRTGYGNPRLNVTRFLTGAVALSLLGVFFAFAWWTNKTSRPSGRGWGIAASLVNILLIIPILTRIHMRAGALLWLIPIAGIIGIVLFSEPPEQTGPVARRQKIRPIP